MPDPCFAKEELAKNIGFNTPGLLISIRASILCVYCIGQLLAPFSLSPQLVEEVREKKAEPVHGPQQKT
jgi:hypothetical protein